MVEPLAVEPLVAAAGALAPALFESEVALLATSPADATAVCDVRTSDFAHAMVAAAQLAIRVRRNIENIGGKE